jgi:hypothetical protein
MTVRHPILSRLAENSVNVRRLTGTTIARASTAALAQVEDRTVRRMLRLSWVTCGLLLLSLIPTTPAYARQYHGHGHARFYYGFAYGGWYAPWSFYYPPYFGAYWYPTTSLPSFTRRTAGTG